VTVMDRSPLPARSGPRRDREAGSMAISVCGWILSRGAWGSSRWRPMSSTPATVPRSTTPRRRRPCAIESDEGPIAACASIVPDERSASGLGNEPAEPRFQATSARHTPDLEHGGHGPARAASLWRRDWLPGSEEVVSGRRSAPAPASAGRSQQRWATWRRCTPPPTVLHLPARA